MTRITGFRIIPLALLALAAPAFAIPDHGGRSADGPPCFEGPGGWATRDPGMIEDRRDERAERIADLLDLTEDQRAAFDKLRGDAFESARPKLDQLRSAHEELCRLLDSGSNDAQAVGSKMIEIRRLREELKATKDGVESELVKLLDSSQKFAFDALKEARHDFEERRFDRGFDRFGDRRWDRRFDHHDDRRPTD